MRMPIRTWQIARLEQDTRARTDEPPQYSKVRIERHSD